jgi:hypothetical protein
MEFKDELKNKIKFMIKCDLLHIRIANNLTPFTDDEIDNFIIENDNIINDLIQNMVKDYENNNELDKLKDASFDQIKKYYHIIDVPIQNI